MWLAVKPPIPPIEDYSQQQGTYIRIEPNGDVTRIMKDTSCDPDYDEMPLRRTVKRHPMKFYVIAHRATQIIMTAQWSRGASWWQPDEDSSLYAKEAVKYPPRLFNSKRAANAFISSWVRGRFNITSRDVTTGITPYVEECIEIKHDPSRARDQLMILPATLTIGDKADEVV